MLFEFEQMSPADRYFLMTQAVIPRPIAWILTDNLAGKPNLAPFSFFAPVCSDPPTLVVSIGNKPDGSQKDTYANLQRTGECVVHIASVDHKQSVNESSATLPANESEVEHLGLSVTEFVDGGLPRLSDADIALHCRFQQEVNLGEGPQYVVFLTVVQVYVNDDVLVNNKGRHQIAATRLNPLGRLGGKEYSTLGELIELQRPL